MGSIPKKTVEKDPASPRLGRDPASLRHAVASKGSVIEAVRKAIEAAGGRRISLRKFVAASGMRQGEVFRYYAKWNDVLRDAGIDCRAHNSRIDDAGMLGDWGCVARKLKRIPRRSEYDIHGKYDAGSLERRFGSWIKVRGAFRAFATGRTEWADVMAFLPAARGEGVPPVAVTASRLGDRPLCGMQIDLGGLRYAPTNEDGVIFVFGMVAERLGFQVEALQAAFPDCEAKQRVGPLGWQSVRIEFEYESRNFRDHGHDAEGCDIIVCWVHNWEDCPRNLEVIALSEEVKRLTLSADAAASIGRGG